MSPAPSELARRLADRAELVCRRYLSQGCRIGSYWVIGDARNNPGRSMFVRLCGPSAGKRAAGKWTDAATGEHGDLLDIIRESRGLSEFGAVLAEAHDFLNLPTPAPEPTSSSAITPSSIGGPESARRLFAMSRPIRGTIAEAYLRGRGIFDLQHVPNLRFHPRCFYRPDRNRPPQAWPALVAAVTTCDGIITGVHRTWLDPSGCGKAKIETPRRAIGYLLGNGVRFGVSDDVLAAGEGIETILSLRCVFPSLPMVAALSAAHLAALSLPSRLRRLYIARDADPAGDAAVAILTQRAEAAGAEAIVLSPRLGDFNDDLSTFGAASLRTTVQHQLAPNDAIRFLSDPKRRHVDHFTSLFSIRS